MPLSINIADLTVIADGKADKIDFARRSEKAAELVHEFVQQSSLSALDAFLNVGTDSYLEASRAAASAAANLAEQTEMVEQEVTRFLAQAPKG